MRIPSIIKYIKSIFGYNLIERSGIRIGIVDDHAIFLQGISGIVKDAGYTVLFSYLNGLDVVEKIDKDNLPDIVLMAVDMPGMDGLQTTLWLKQNHPKVKVLAMGMSYDNDITTLLRENGAKGYILKVEDPLEFCCAIHAIHTKGVYNSGNLHHYRRR